MSARNSFPEDHPLFAGFLAADRERIVASLAGTISSWCSARRYSPIMSKASGRTCPTARSLFQLVDDPAIAAWAPVGTADRDESEAQGSATCSTGPSRGRAPHPPGARQAPRLSGPPLTDAI